MSNDRCPTCKHMHPEGVGLFLCGCKDCFLLFGDVPFAHMGEEAQARVLALHAQMKPGDAS